MSDNGAQDCCCESSPPEFGGNLPDRECPIHGDRRGSMSDNDLLILAQAIEAHYETDGCDCGTCLSHRVIYPTLKRLGVIG